MECNSVDFRFSSALLFLATIIFYYSNKFVIMSESARTSLLKTETIPNGNIICWKHLRMHNSIFHPVFSWGTSTFVRGIGFFTDAYDLFVMNLINVILHTNFCKNKVEEGKVPFDCIDSM